MSEETKIEAAETPVVAGNDEAPVQVAATEAPATEAVAPAAETTATEAVAPAAETTATEAVAPAAEAPAKKAAVKKAPKAKKVQQERPQLQHLHRSASHWMIRLSRSRSSKPRAAKESFKEWLTSKPVSTTRL